MEYACHESVIPDFSRFDSPGSIARSWQRCRSSPELAGSPLAVIGDTALVVCAQPVVDGLRQHLAGSTSVILLANAPGNILRCLGEPGVLAEAARIGLLPGADWSEEAAGTNAIGTALFENRTVDLAGDAHYLVRNRGLNCVAAPFGGGDGAPVGALAIATAERVDSTHARALVEMYADFIEERLIEAIPEGVVHLRFNRALDAVGSPLDGLAAFSREGRLVACSRRAYGFLPDDLFSHGNFAASFATPWEAVLTHASRRGDAPVAVDARDGGKCFIRINFRQGWNPSATPARGRPDGGGVLLRGLANVESGRLLGDLGSEDPRMAAAIRRASRIMECDIPLLIQGETGSGKEWFAQAFHNGSSRASGPFVAVNCAAIPASLIEAELFGYVEGAFTGARRVGARGKIREANGGTLFLDEIGDMPLALQAVLLRVLETRRVMPLGGDCDESVDLVLVCASHQPLQSLVSNGLFRADLFFRLSGMTVSLPPLRERRDFERVVARILKEESPDCRVEIAPAALDILRRYGWPGNLRQLRNVLRLSIALLDGGNILTPDLLPSELFDGEVTPAGIGPGLRAVQIRLVRETVERHGGNISAAARELGITRTTLYRKLGAER